MSDYRPQPIVFSEGNALPDPAYARALRRWSLQVVPPWERCLIHSPRCDSLAGDPTCGACQVIAEAEQRRTARAREDTP